MLNLNKDYKYDISFYLQYRDNMFYLLDLAPLVVPQLALHDEGRLLIRDVVSLLPFCSPVLEPDFNLKIETEMISIYKFFYTQTQTRRFDSGYGYLIHFIVHLLLC